MPATRFYPLRLARIEHNAGARVLTFDVPALLAPRFAWRAGQYVTVRAKIGTEFVDRAYAICTAPHEGLLQIAVKQVADGTMSTWMHETLVPGRWLTLAPPAGSFTIDTDPNHARHYAGFCTGSGVTTLYAQLKHILQTEPESRFTLVVADALEDSVIFLAELRQLQRRFPQRFSCLLVLGEAAPGVAACTGLLDATTIGQLFARELHGARIDAALVVGSPAMMDTTAALLAAHGVPAHAIRTARAAPARPAAAQTVVTTHERGSVSPWAT